MKIKHEARYEGLVCVTTSKVNVAAELHQHLGDLNLQIDVIDTITELGISGSKVGELLYSL